jgi:hypothetical protein
LINNLTNYLGETLRALRALASGYPLHHPLRAAHLWCACTSRVVTLLSLSLRRLRREGIGGFAASSSKYTCIKYLRIINANNALKFIIYFVAKKRFFMVETLHATSLHQAQSAHEVRKREG